MSTDNPWRRLAAAHERHLKRLPANIWPADTPTTQAVRRCFDHGTDHDADKLATQINTELDQ